MSTELVDKVEMQPWLDNLIFRDPEQDRETSYQRVFAEINGVPERDVVDVVIADGLVKYSVMLRAEYTPPALTARTTEGNA